MGRWKGTPRMRREVIFLNLLSLLAVFASSAVIAQGEEATLTGTVKDAQSGDPLPGAIVQVQNSGLGASTDLDGKFIIHNVPPGLRTLHVIYVGYRENDLTIAVKQGENDKQEFRLAAIGIEGEEVVVTAQVAGQTAAINQQLSALPIVNVVSRARIQELPDANAAESVSRLPGVSLIRTGGEGSKVVIRGLSPQFNQITFDGVEMPSNVASANNIIGRPEAGGGLGASGDALGDRGGDLSMVSSGMLEGIKITKSITPDMDAAVIGGVVDFGLRKAVRSEQESQRDELWIPRIDLKIQGGYSKLRNSYDNYRYAGSLEKRFFDQSFGVFLQGTAERRNLSSNVMEAHYELEDKNHGDAPFPGLSSMALEDVLRMRERFGGTLVLDYQHESGEIALMNFLSTSKTQEIAFAESINPLSESKIDALTYSARESNNELNVVSNLLSVKQDLWIVRADVKLSHSYSETRNPEDLYFNFWQEGSSAAFANRGDLRYVEPGTLASFASHDAAMSWFNSCAIYKSISKERNISASMDLATDIALAENLSGRIKVGGMFQHRTREYDMNFWYAGDFFYEITRPATSFLDEEYPWIIREENGWISMRSFIDDQYEYSEFLRGGNTLGYPMYMDKMWEIARRLRRSFFFEPMLDKRENLINDYSGYENKSAGYIMLALKLGNDFTFIPGARYQNLTTNYTAIHGTNDPNTSRLLQAADTTIGRSHGYLLPMVHVLFDPTDWLRLHFAYTRTLNYPDYSTITPRYLINPAPGVIDYNNRDLEPATSENLDLVVAFHSNEIGLFTLSGFKKRIKDLVFFSTTYISDLRKYPVLPQGGTQLLAFNTYINNPNPVDLWGIETEWQTHFWYLPRPFDGLVLNVNYTHTFSDASYPRSIVDVQYDDEGNMDLTVIDTFYTTRLLNQPNDIVNLSVGYDFRGFSVRLSMIYQDNIFKRPDFWLQQRINSAAYTRWDLSVKQSLPWSGITLYFNVSNIDGEDDLDVNQKNLFPASQQRYGMSADLGIQIRL